MPTISIPLSGGSPTAVTLLSLQDIFGNIPSGVTFPSSFTLTGGSWQFTFAGNSATYNFTYSVTNASQTIGPFAGTITQNAGYQGRYINSTLLTTYLGSVNVQIQSDADSTGQQNSQAIQQCIMAAEDECDSTVSNSPTGLQVPISFGTNPINASLQLALYQLAGTDLYDKRLLSSTTKKMPPWGDFRKRAGDWLKMVWYGDRILTGAVYNPPQTAPTGAIQTVNAASLPIVPNGASPWLSWWPYYGFWGAYGCGNSYFGWGYSWFNG